MWPPTRSFTFSRFATVQEEPKNIIISTYSPFSDLLRIERTMYWHGQTGWRKFRKEHFWSFLQKYFCGTVRIARKKNHIFQDFKHAKPEFFARLTELFARIRPVCESLVIRHFSFDYIIPLTDSITFKDDLNFCYAVNRVGDYDPETVISTFSKVFTVFCHHMLN